MVTYLFSYLFFQGELNQNRAHQKCAKQEQTVLKKKSVLVSANVHKKKFLFKNF